MIPVVQRIVAPAATERSDDMASMNTKFQEILNKAIARVTDDRGEWIEPDEQTTEETRFAWALLSVAGQGPFEDQAARLRAWADEREERFGAVRDVLDKLGISSQVGPLERQVEILGEQRDQLRQHLARDAGAPAAATPLESMVITPIVDREQGLIVSLLIGFRGSPGFELRLVGAAGAELRDFLNHLPTLCGAQLPPPPARPAPPPRGERALDIGGDVAIRLDADGGGLIWRHPGCKAWMTLRYRPDPRSTGHVLVEQWPNLTIEGSLLCPAGCGKHGFIRGGRWVTG